MLSRARQLSQTARRAVGRESAPESDSAGTARLDRRIAVVCGGTGEVGEGIVEGLLHAGARVVVPSRSGERLADLADRLDLAGAPTGRLVPVLGDLTDPHDGAARVAAEVVRLAGAPDLVVVAVGGWYQTPPLVELEIDEWDEILDGSLRAHQLAAGALVPLLRGRPGATYVQINGAAARYPVPGAGAVSVASAANLMAAQVMAAEEAGHGIQVEALVLGPVRTRSRDEAAPWMVSARAIGDLIALRASRRISADAGGGPATVLEMLTVADLPGCRAAHAGAVRSAHGAALGWVLWGLQTASLRQQVRRGTPPQGL